MNVIYKDIEHALLDPTVTASQIDSLVQYALSNGAHSICVPPFWVKRAKREIGDKDLCLATPVGAPFGYQMTETKMTEIKCALSNGVNEIDFMLNVSAFVSGMSWPKIELAKASKLAHENEVFVKVMVDVSLFHSQSAVEITKIAVDAGVDFVHLIFPDQEISISKEYFEEYTNAISNNIGLQVSSRAFSERDVAGLIAMGAERVGLNYSM